MNICVKYYIVPRDMADVEVKGGDPYKIGSQNIPTSIIMHADCLDSQPAFNKHTVNIAKVSLATYTSLPLLILTEFKGRRFD